MIDWHNATLAWLPALFVCAMYLIFLGYRRDYIGHYAAGYGATLAAVCAIQSSLKRDTYCRYVNSIALGGTLLSIAAGAVAEATVFRLARFDEIDFCNQSVGAVMAGLVSWKLGQVDKPNDATFAACMASGLVHLLVGTYFALT